MGFGARCYLGAQQETVLSSIFDRFRDEFEAHAQGAAPPTEPVLVTEILDIDDGEALLDEVHRRKQPDWTFDRVSSGATPADLRSRYVKAWARR
jgi:hypothetical protein